MNVNKTLLAAICISTCCSAFANETSNDTPAYLQITGDVNNAESNCSVSLSTSNMMLQNINIISLPEQGSKASIDKMDSFGVKLSGDKCDKTGITFISGTDNISGNTLNNNLTTPSAAKGVGIEVFDNHADPINFNETVDPVWQLFSNNYPVYLRMTKLTGKTPVQGDVQASMTVQLENL